MRGGDHVANFLLFFSRRKARAAAERYDDTVQYCAATAAMATSFFEHVTRPGGVREEAAGGETGRPGESRHPGGIVVGNCPAA